MPTILITAGEPSGDRLGAALIAALKRKRKNLRFIGVGGAQMRAQGLESAFPMEDLAVMGLAEVLPAIPRILARIRQLARLARREKPSLILTIDSHDFSIRLARALHHLGVPHVHYAAPKIWAWRQGRARKIKGLYTHLLAFMPFEEEFFRAFGIPTTYVGHPTLTTLLPESRKPKTESRLSLALLPGSRSGELTRHWPLMLATYRRLKKLHPHLTATLALPSQEALTACRHLAGWEAADAIHPVFGEERFAALARCRAALAKSGTVNLELALLGIPTVVCYRMNALTYLLAKWLVKVPYISLPNLILGKCVFPEFIQSAATPDNLARALSPLLHDARTHARVATQLEALRARMRTPIPPADLAAKAVLAHLPA